MDNRNRIIDALAFDEYDCLNKKLRESNKGCSNEIGCNVCAEKVLTDYENEIKEQIISLTISKIRKLSCTCGRDSGDCMKIGECFDCEWGVIEASDIKELIKDLENLKES